MSPRTRPVTSPSRRSGGATAQERIGGLRGVGLDFLVQPASLDNLSLTGDRGGVVLGSDQRGSAVQLHLLRSTPTRLVLLGGLYLARQVVLRAAATGASVVIATGRPAAWTPVVLATGSAGGPHGRAAGPVQVRGLQPGPLPRAGEDTPLLVVHDGSAVPHELYPSRSAWHTTAYVLPYLHPQVGTTATSADLVLMQRLPVGQARLAGRMWQLSHTMVQQLATLTDDGVAALSTGFWLPLRLSTTPKESALLGPVRRGD